MTHHRNGVTAKNLSPFLAQSYKTRSHCLGARWFLLLKIWIKFKSMAIQIKVFEP